MTRTHLHAILAVTLTAIFADTGSADPPVASYVFPAGCRRGAALDVRIGGLFLHERCRLEMTGTGITAEPRLRRTPVIWFEGPFVPLPESQQPEDYPSDYLARVETTPDAVPGVRTWRLVTSQGVTPTHLFQVGELPEVLEQEVDASVDPVPVTLPVTINGRIFPRENVDRWAFRARKGQTITCEVFAARLGSPLDSRLEVLGPDGRPVAENDDARGTDSLARFTAAADGVHVVKIHDTQLRGGPAFVYRLTVTADPTVDWIYPLGGRLGSEITAEAGAGRDPASFRETVRLPDHARASVGHRFGGTGCQTNEMLLQTGSLPEHLEVEPNDDPLAVEPVTVPAVLNGRIGTPGDVDSWAFAGKKGVAYSLDLWAGRLGSPLEGVLVLSDDTGKELTRSDAAANGLADPRLMFVPPADGVYRVRVADRFRARGGPGFGYRLVIEPGDQPGFRLFMASDAVNVPFTGDARWRVEAERQGGFNDPIKLSFEGLPAGLVVQGDVIGPGQPAADVVFRQTLAATPGLSWVTVVGRPVPQPGARRVEPAPGPQTVMLRSPRGFPDRTELAVAVSMRAPFRIVGDVDYRWAPRGSLLRRHYRVERHGFDGPIEVRLAERQTRHLQGITGPTVVVSPGATEFDYGIYLPPWMETGRTARAVVMGVGLIRDIDGNEHEVSYTSVTPNEQITAIIEPGRLDLSTDVSSAAVGPGRPATVPVRVSRGKNLHGAVKIELTVPPHLGRVTAAPLTIPDGRDRGELVITVPDGRTVSGVVPVVVRATVTGSDGPAFAEAKLDLTPARAREQE